MSPARNRTRKSVPPDPSSASSPAMSTRSRAKVDITYYSKVNGDDSNGVQVISKKRMTGMDYNKLEEKLSKIEQDRSEKVVAVPEGKKTTILLVTHFNVFLYATCFFIQTGTLPYLSKQLGADPVTFGQLQTVFAVTQLLGGPLYGRMGDVLGERVALLVAFASSALTYFLTGMSYALPVLFASRLPSVFMHVMQGSQMIVTSLSDEHDRASGLARLGFSYGIGMVVGPTLGGYVTKFFGEQNAALLAASGSVLSFLLVLIFIPNFSKTTDKKESVFNLKEIFGLLLSPGTGMLLVIKAVCGIPIGVLQSMFSVIAMDRFGLPPEKNGMMLSYIGAVSLFMQGIGISTLTSRLSDQALMKFATFTLLLAYYALTLIREVFDFLVLLFPLTCSLCLVNSILTAAITKTVSSSHTGTILGLNMAVHSTIRTVAPTVGGYLLNSYGFESIGMLGVASNVLVLMLVGRAKLKEA